jgi:hypothetical protein
MGQAVGTFTDLRSPPLIGGAIPLIDVAIIWPGSRRSKRKLPSSSVMPSRMSAFYHPAGHGVPQALIDAQCEQAARFHALLFEAKLAVKVDEHTIGYMPIPDKATPNAIAQGKKPSQNEAYFLRRERDADDPDVVSGRRFHAMNTWLADLPGSSSTPITTRSSSAYRAASRWNPPNTRRSSSATTPFGLLRSATTTWPR